MPIAFLISRLTRPFADVTLYAAPQVHEGDSFNLWYILGWSLFSAPILWIVSATSGIRIPAQKMAAFNANPGFRWKSPPSCAERLPYSLHSTAGSVRSSDTAASNAKPLGHGGLFLFKPNSGSGWGRVTGPQQILVTYLLHIYVSDIPF